MCGMIASNTFELLYYKRIGRQRGRGFGVLVKVIGRTANPFLRKYIVPAEKRVGADLLEFALPEVADVLAETKISKLLPKACEDRQTWEVKNLKRSSRSRREIFTNIANK